MTGPQDLLEFGQVSLRFGKLRPQFSHGAVIGDDSADGKPPKDCPLPCEAGPTPENCPAPAVLSITRSAEPSLSV